jgi:hypothetical protein
MNANQVKAVLIVALALAGGGVALAVAQEGQKAKDDALDALLQKLGEAQHSGSGAGKGSSPGKSAPGLSKRARSAQAGSKEQSGSTAGAGKRAQGPGARSNKPAGSKSSEGSVAPKDRELDALLEKLGQTKDEAASEDSPRTPGGGLEEPKEKTEPARPAAAKLGGKDKEIDQRLEELTGRRKKRPQSDEERGGAIGQIIKQMREVEQRLGKPDTGDDTQTKQKQVVKRIEDLIEQVRRSGASAAGLRIRMARRPGEQQGGQPGDQTGALARGAPPMKPARPPSRHADVGGKDVWGHLPPELRQVMENSFKEVSLSAKAELISRYFLSISKGKLVREE